MMVRNKQGFLEVRSPRKAIRKSPNPWAGGIFGQPPSPANRTGMFIANWPMAPDERFEDEGVFDRAGNVIPGSANYPSSAPMKLVPPRGKVDVYSRKRLLVPGSGQKQLGAEEDEGKGGYWLQIQKILGITPIHAETRSIQEQMRDSERNAWIRFGIVAFMLWKLLK